MTRTATATRRSGSAGPRPGRRGPARPRPPRTRRTATRTATTSPVPAPRTAPTGRWPPTADPGRAPRRALGEDEGMRLVACDLDGTIVWRDGTVTSRTVSALEACEVAGVRVVFVTGRPPRWMAPIADATG